MHRNKILYLHISNRLLKNNSLQQSKKFFETKASTKTKVHLHPRIPPLSSKVPEEGKPLSPRSFEDIDDEISRNLAVR